jgi:hypothetical protein
VNCPVCFGIGEVLMDENGRPARRLRDGVAMVPCPNPDCNGGKTHCCEGDCAQPEAEE